MHRRDVDDGALAELLHMRDGILGAHELAFEVDRQAAVPIFAGGIQHRFVHSNPGIIDQDIDLAEVIQGRLDHGFDLVFIRDIAFDKDGLAAGFAQLFGSFMAFFIVPIHHNHFGAFFDKNFGDPPANAFGAAGNDCNLSFSFIDSFLLIC